MNDLRNPLCGLGLPLITPFRNGVIDQVSVRRLVHHYANAPIDGLILAATSGEGLSLTPSELELLVRLVRMALDDAGRDMPICLGLAGASTARLLEELERTACWPIDGYLISSPYYLRPSQRGLMQHFTDLADHAARPVVLYNIPYRTSVALTNETLLSLAAHPNIVGLKDCCADRSQSSELLRRRPAGFRVLSGEDARCGWRHPALGPRRDRRFREHPPPSARGRRRSSRHRMARRRRTDPAPVRRAQPCTRQVLAVANGPDRRCRGPVADGRGE
jgi:4-hydroxy-tetrahydrodipicolinate synthase